MLEDRWLTTSKDEYRLPTENRIKRYLEAERLRNLVDDCINVNFNDQVENKEKDEPEENSNLIENINTQAQESKEEEKLQFGSHCNFCHLESQNERPVKKDPFDILTKPYNKSSYINDYRDPAFPYIENKYRIQKIFDEKLKAYKEKIDAEKREIELKKFAAISQREKAKSCYKRDHYCKNKDIFDFLYAPEDDNEKEGRKENLEDNWWKEESSDEAKKTVQNFIWTTSYREMIRDGVLPSDSSEEAGFGFDESLSSIERPPGDKFKNKDCSPPIPPISAKDFEQWDRCQLRRSEGEMRTINSDPCLDYDPYFKEQHLCRSRFGKTQFHEKPSEENMKLVRENKIRMPFDKMIPGYLGYKMIESPNISKIKTELDPTNYFQMMSTNQADFIPFPKEFYSEKAKSDNQAFNFEKILSSNPMNYCKKPLPKVNRLSCNLGHDKKIHEDNHNYNGGDQNRICAINPTNCS